MLWIFELFVEFLFILSGGGGERHSDDFTVRITNLPEDSDTLEDDLRFMFGKVGRIVRFYLARDKTTNRPKGFAFVTFSTSAEAEKAIQQFNGEKMEHLILKVEWTKWVVKLKILNVP